MAASVQYKCPRCGGALDFDAAAQKMVCPFCDSTFDVSEFKAQDEKLQGEKKDGPVSGQWDTSAGSSWGEGEQDSLRVWVCGSCGGEIIGDQNTAAAICPYCGNRTVISGQLSGSLKPDLIIPFQLDKKAAAAAFEANLRGKRLLPRVFRDRHHIDEIKGVYVPYWLFDADVDASVNYEATRVRTWRSASTEYTETSYYLVNRYGSMSFDKIPADGSQKMPDDLTESIEPFHYDGAAEFSAAYLAGYCADKYDVSADDSLKRINFRVKNSAETAFAASVAGYSAVQARSSQITLKSSKARYAMLPVWLLTTTWEKKNYLFAMNGQTGKFVGNLPIDKKLYHLWLWGLTAALTAVWFCIGLRFFLR